MRQDVRLPARALAFYGLPSLGVSFAFFLVNLYLMKFATDVLAIAPGVMGLLFGLSKLWDAVSDPVAGHLSDRTRSRLGRRRSWMLAGALPVGLGFLLLWAAPPALGPAGTVAWMAIAIFVFYTGTTVFLVPHESLGAELSRDHHERTRIVGVRQAFSVLGTLASVGGLGLLMASTRERDAALVMGAAVAAAMVASIALAVANVREPEEHQGRGGESPWRAFRDVVANPHARLLLGVFAVETFGTATLAALVVYVTEYVIGEKDMTWIFLSCYTVPALLCVPVAIVLSRRFGKKNLWVFSMGVLTGAFSGLFFVGEGDVVLVCSLGVLAGIGSAFGQVVGPSIQADVIDWDEWRTGERKEGAYFAVWNFVRKLAFGLPPIMLGFVLEVAGYVPNAPQSEETQLALRTLFGLVPGACYALGTLFFLRFSLTEARHAEIRAELDARR